MRVACIVVWAAVLTGFSVDAACGDQVGSDSSLNDAADAASVVNGKLLPSLPLKCLRQANCDARKDLNAFEIGSEPIVDWNFDAKGNLIRETPATTNERGRLLEQVAPLVTRLSKEAADEAKDAQDPVGKWQSRANAQIKTEKKELPSPPEAYVRLSNEYIAGRAFLDCKTGYRTLALAQQSSKLKGAERDAVLATAYAKYVFGCFLPAPAVIKHRIAVFWTPWPERGPMGAFCLGYALDEQHVVTAKHCVIDPNAMRLWEKAKNKKPVPLYVVPWAKISFSDSLGAPYDYKISTFHELVHDLTFDPRAFGNDIAIVTLSVPRKLPVADIETASPWRLITTVTAFLSLEMIQACVNSNKSAECDGSTLVRFDDTTNCVTPTEKSGCLLHSCQTRAGASGGPILARDEKAQTLLGVHTGSIDTTAPQCALPKGKYFPNYGASASVSRVLSAWKQQRDKR
ncbi:Trypsin [Caballeronia terrestris]|uniref:Serine protease n=2 Tax=Caballeronia terrestris TaxID=1226301 RepID=A0A158HZV0_9BURK|nr:Trypsin [Caballeronia terrestris]